MAVESPGCRAVAYRRRRPEQATLYQVVHQHLETYLALAAENDWDGQRVPALVEGELRRYLECGVLADGFAPARCPDCGHDFLVAFSCKGRALCPSCNARRMAETAAHLVNHLFPPLPVRQWVLSVPKRLRWYLERELPRPPPITLARGPPAWADALEPMPDCDLFGQPAPDVEFDQRVAW